MPLSLPAAPSHAGHRELRMSDSPRPRESLPDEPEELVGGDQQAGLLQGEKVRVSGLAELTGLSGTGMKPAADVHSSVVTCEVWKPEDFS